MTGSEVQRKIIHIDMDCFYAAVEVLDAPSLYGKPVIVGGTSKRGVVCAASYEARKYGVRSAMPLFQAHKLCPQGVYLPVRMARYQELSRSIQSIFYRYTDLVQPISLDEAFLDVSQNKKEMVYAMDIAREIRESIRNETGLTASAGVAPNKFLAKIASDCDKPDGLFVIRPHEVKEFMKTLPIGKIWGVGKVMEKKLLDLGVHYASELMKIPEDFLLSKFGKFGPHLLRLAQGVDMSAVTPSREPKSIGNETTFAENKLDSAYLRSELSRLVTKVALRLKRKGYVCRGVQVKVKYDTFDVHTRSSLLSDLSNEEADILSAAETLLERTEAGSRPIRLVGIAVSHLEQSLSEEPSLFELLENNYSSAERLQDSGD